MKRCRVEILAASVCSSPFCQLMQVFLLHSSLILYRLCDECLVIIMTTDVGEGLLKFFSNIGKSACFILLKLVMQITTF